MPVLGVEVKVNSALPSNCVQRFVVLRIAALAMPAMLRIGLAKPVIPGMIFQQFA